MIKTVLVAFDGSDPSDKAFDFALGIAAAFRANLVVLGVVTLPEPAVSVEVEAMLDGGRQHFAEEFEQLERRAASQGVDLETRVAVGHPAKQVLKAEQDTRADLIVMGRRGTTRATRWLLGSVSERVLRYARCPVTVVK